MSIHPPSKIDPLQFRATRIDEANSFQSGQFIAQDGASRVLADNTNRARPAFALVAAAAPDRYWIFTNAGEPVEWNDHGFSVGTYRWLGTAGGTTTPKPGGPTVQVEQVVLLVLDADHVQLFPQQPITF